MLKWLIINCFPFLLSSYVCCRRLFMFLCRCCHVVVRLFFYRCGVRVGEKCLLRLVHLSGYLTPRLPLVCTWLNIYSQKYYGLFLQSQNLLSSELPVPLPLYFFLFLLLNE